MATNRDFVHLHLHTDLSLLQASTQIKKLAPRLTELGMHSCAITDQGNMYGTISFYNTMKANGIHPILGYEAYLTYGNMREKAQPLRAGERPYYQLVLLAESLEGYYNLAYLASKAFTEGLHYKPRIDLDILSQHSKGLIALSGGLNGVLGHYFALGNYDEAKNKAAQFQEIFGKDNFFIEVQDHGLTEEKEFNQHLIKLSKDIGASLVAANESFYLTQEDARAHELLLCIGEGKTVNDPTRTQLGNNNFYVRSPEEMWKVFGKELPDALTRTARIAERCQVKLPKPEDEYYLPNFPIPPDSNCATDAEYFEKVVMDGFARRKETIWEPAHTAGVLKYPFEDYLQRVKHEIEIINGMKFPGYFLVVWEFIKYAKEKNIPVGPGRGSAAGSLVAYCLEITDVDPIQYELLFERFLNPERVTMPDIDIDFCVRGRADVIQHVTELYGAEQVCQIVTFGTMASRAAIKDVGRALEMTYAEVEKVSKLIPPPIRGRNVSITQAIDTVPDLKKAMDTDRRVKELVDLALRLEGCSRHSSVHAAGVVISPKPLHELIPVALSTRDELTTQYAMTDLEKTGMLKMDFLALTTLTIIDDCIKSIKAKLEIEIDWLSVPPNEEKTMQLFADGKTQAIFQFESQGMAEITRRLKPKGLEDLSALNALYRPGPLDGGMVEDFIDRHHGKKKVRYILPEMEEFLKNTYGIIVYQEQIMQLAQKLAGYSLGAADMMRRAMGKKKRDEMAKHEEQFINGAIERGHKKEKAEEIFHLMAQFADYGFNRSHSMAYAYLAFQTGFLKAHYPSFFYASVLSNEADDSAKIYKYAVELRSLGIKLLPPDVNESDADFTPVESAVRFGLHAIKGIGGSTVQAILRARNEGRFTSLSDFTSRIDQGAINKRGLEGLICAGAFDSLKPVDCPVNLWRAKVHAGIEQALSYAQKTWNDKLSGQSGLFGMEEFSGDAQEELPDVVPWSSERLAAEEKAAIGFHLTCHPLENFSSLLSQLKIPKIAELEAAGGETVTLAGAITTLQVKPTKKGTLFGMFKLEDESSGLKCRAWSESYSKYSGLLKNDQLVLITGRVEGGDQPEPTLIVDEVMLLSDIVHSKARRALISLPYDSIDQRFLEDIFALLDRNKGKCEVYFAVNTENNFAVNIAASGALGISGSRELEDELKARNCRVDWVLSN
ncbi:MAG TPA: DNA polymerase III subunit alpha [Pyrinomonadaceae bacterium]|jgi:DNA polymerase-3 subunit alpha|nr:DNA polymerase III subunit alpha [Pyrinomonadaceae bacterium]